MASNINKSIPIDPPTSHANLVHSSIGEKIVALLVTNVCIIEKSDQTVDVHGIDNHQITNIPIMTAGDW